LRAPQDVADEHRDVALPCSLEQAGRCHRAFTVSAHHDDRSRRQVAHPVGQVPELDVAGAR